MKKIYLLLLLLITTNFYASTTPSSELKRLLTKFEEKEAQNYQDIQNQKLLSHMFIGKKVRPYKFSLELQTNFNKSIKITTGEADFPEALPYPYHDRFNSKLIFPLFKLFNDFNSTYWPLKIAESIFKPYFFLSVMASTKEYILLSFGNIKDVSMENYHNRPGQNGALAWGPIVVGCEKINKSNDLYRCSPTNQGNNFYSPMNEYVKGNIIFQVKEIPLFSN